MAMTMVKLLLLILYDLDIVLIPKTCTLPPLLCSVVAEPLYGLGFPRRRYVAQKFECTVPGLLRTCRYDTLIDARCYDGPHVAGIRCIESKI